MTIKTPLHPTHSLKIIDNWDGEGDIVFIFAFKHNDKFYCYANSKPVLVYDGDKILEAWELAT